MQGWVIALIIVGCVIVFLFVILFLTSYVKAGPDEAIMISGMGKKKILIGKAGFRIPFFQRQDKLSLKVFQVDIKTDEPIPTTEFININVDGVANLKISSDPELLHRAFESLLGISNADLQAQVQQILQGNMREIIGTANIKTLVQNRKGIAEKVMENVVPDMAKLGIEVVNFNIQNFSDSNSVIYNLGIDNVSQIQKDASIAKANAERDIAIAKAEADKEANDARVNSALEIAAQNNALELKKAELKRNEDIAKADADVAYEIQRQKQQLVLNNNEVEAEIAKKTKEITLNEKSAEIAQKKLDAEINKKADAEKYKAEREADASLYSVVKNAEAEASERKAKADADLYEAEKRAASLIAEANAKKEAALAEAEGIRAKGEAEAEAIKKKAEAMKQYGEAATLQLVLDSNVIPNTVEAYAKPTAEALSKIGNITMYGEGNTAKLGEEITKNGTQIFQGIKEATGIDVATLLAGYLGGKIAQKQQVIEVKEKGNK
jgi:flotillin